GEIIPRDFHVEIPRERMAEAREVAKVLGMEVFDRFPFPPGGRPVSADPYELILNNTWRPALAITGAAGLPLPADGGNVLRPKTRAEARAAPAAAVRRGRCGAQAQGGPRGRPAVRRARHHGHLRRRGQRLERAGDRSQAPRVDPARVTQLLRQAGGVRGPRRL